MPFVGNKLGGEGVSSMGEMGRRGDGKVEGGLILVPRIDDLRFMFIGNGMWEAVRGKSG